MTLAQQIDHMGKLTHQLPVPPLRVVYAASGMHVAAGLVQENRALIDSKLYWASVRSENEGYFLIGVLNSPILTALVRPLMSYGKDERDIHKHVWKLPIPEYDEASERHRHIATLSRQLSGVVADLKPRSSNFVTIRRDLRAHLASDEQGKILNKLVAELLDADPTDTVQTSELSAPLLIRTNLAPLPPPSDIEIDVDCEFDENGHVYLWGATVSGNTGQPSYQHFGNPDTDEKKSADEFAHWLIQQIDAAVTQGRSIAWYHYGHVELTHLNRLLDPAALAAIAPHGTDLLTDIIRPGFYGPQGLSLKKLAPAAGATWRTSGATAQQSLIWIAEARAGNPDAWQRLLEYNEDDTRATCALRQLLRQATTPGWTPPKQDLSN